MIMLPFGSRDNEATESTERNVFCCAEKLISHLMPRRMLTIHDVPQRVVLCVAARERKRAERSRHHCCCSVNIYIPFPLSTRTASISIRCSMKANGVFKFSVALFGGRRCFFYFLYSPIEGNKKVRYAKGTRILHSEPLSERFLPSVADLP